MAKFSSFMIVAVLSTVFVAVCANNTSPGPPPPPPTLADMENKDNSTNTGNSSAPALHEGSASGVAEPHKEVSAHNSTELAAEPAPSNSTSAFHIGHKSSSATTPSFYFALIVVAFAPILC